MVLQEIVVLQMYGQLLKERTQTKKKKQYPKTHPVHTITHYLFCCNTGVMMHRTGSQLHFSLPSHTKLNLFPVCVRNKPAPAKAKTTALALRKTPSDQPGENKSALRSSQFGSSNLIATWKELVNAQCLHVQWAASLYFDECRTIAAAHWDVKQRGFFKVCTEI